MNHKEKMAQGKINAQKEWQKEKADFVLVYERKITDYFLTLPDTCKKLWHRCFIGKSTCREAIKAKCYDCSAYDRDEIRFCTVQVCPLWNHRPLKTR